MGTQPTLCPSAGVQHAGELLERVYGARQDDVVAAGGAARGVGLPPGRVLPLGEGRGMAKSRKEGSVSGAYRVDCMPGREREER